MLSERPWKVEAVAGLFAAIMFGLVFAGLISMGLAHASATKTIFGNRFIQFVINTFAFQGIALISLTAFLRYHGVGWSELFGLRNVRWRTIGLALLVVAPAAGKAARGVTWPRTELRGQITPRPTLCRVPKARLRRDLRRVPKARVRWILLRIPV
jgi:hypothetical protein